MAGERRGLLRPLRPPLRPLRPEGCRDPNVVVLLLLHGAVVGGLGKAEVVVRDPLTAKVTNCCRDRPGGSGLVELAARAVGAVEVGVDQIWSKALLKYNGVSSLETANPSLFAAELDLSRCN